MRIGEQKQKLLRKFELPRMLHKQLEHAVQELQEHGAPFLSRAGERSRTSLFPPKSKGRKLFFNEDEEAINCTVVRVHQ